MMKIDILTNIDILTVENRDEQNIDFVTRIRG